MKATDLMIGDWVQGFVADSYSRVEAIPNEYRLGVITRGGTYIVSVADDFQPIPLTPEILEKNGFGYIEEDEHLMHFHLGGPYYCENMGIHIGTDKNSHFWLDAFDNSIFGLQFVHELQHALRLCGIEKEVVV